MQHEEGIRKFYAKTNDCVVASFWWVELG